MAKIPPDAFLQPGRGIRLKGVGYTLARGDSLQWNAAPRKRRGGPTSAEQDNWDLFARAVRNAQYMSSGQQWTARELSRRTAFQSRDFLMSVLYARMFSIQTPTGRRMISVAARNDISELLDGIGQNPGDILVRGQEWWEPIPAGPTGYLLTSQGPGEVPAYAPPPTLPASKPTISAFSMDSNATVEASALCGKGLLFRADADALVNEVWLRTNVAAGITFRGLVAEITSPIANGTFVTVNTSDPVTDAVTQSACWRRCLFPTPVPLEAGKPYFLGQYRTSGSPTSSIPMYGAGGGAATLMVPGRAGAYGGFASINPIVGGAYTHIGAQGAIGVGVIWSDP